MKINKVNMNIKRGLKFNKLNNLKIFNKITISVEVNKIFLKIFAIQDYLLALRKVNRTKNNSLKLVLNHQIKLMIVTLKDMIDNINLNKV